jgi:hypothetical protein
MSAENTPTPHPLGITQEQLKELQVGSMPHDRQTLLSYIDNGQNYFDASALKYIGDGVILSTYFITENTEEEALRSPRAIVISGLALESLATLIAKASSSKILVTDPYFSEIFANITNSYWTNVAYTKKKGLPASLPTVTNGVSAEKFVNEATHQYALSKAEAAIPGYPLKKGLVHLSMMINQFNDKDKKDDAIEWMKWLCRQQIALGSTIQSTKDFSATTKRVSTYITEPFFLRGLQTLTS